MHRGLRFLFFSTALIFIDQLLKMVMLHLDLPAQVGPFQFAIHLNTGMILGVFKGVSPGLQAISIATLFGILLAGNLLLSQTLPRVSGLQTGLATLLGGFGGNALDKAIRGASVDYLSIVPNVYFNLADCFQWIGLGIFLLSLFKNGKSIWVPNTQRSQILLDRQFQFLFSSRLIFASLGFFLLQVFFTLAYLFHFKAKPNASEIALFFVISLLLMVVYGLAVHRIGLRLSHRMIGPLKAFERFLGELPGDSKPLKLRQDDEFSFLEKWSITLLDYKRRWTCVDKNADRKDQA